MGGHDDEGPAYSGGVRVFSIGGRLVHQRERLMGMTEEERRWRAQFLKDQALSPDEPRFSPELYKSTNNIFVRLSKWPMDLVEKAVTPAIGVEKASAVRYFTSRWIAIYVGVCMMTYYYKYNRQDWTRCGGWYEKISMPRMLPGDPGYPHVPKKEKYEYCDQGFSKSIFW